MEQNQRDAKPPYSSRYMRCPRKISIPHSLYSSRCVPSFFVFFRARHPCGRCVFVFNAGAGCQHCRQHREGDGAELALISRYQQQQRHRPHDVVGGAIFVGTPTSAGHAELGRPGAWSCVSFGVGRLPGNASQGDFFFSCCEMWLCVTFFLLLCFLLVVDDANF